MESRKIKVVVVDKNTLKLDEDAHAGDIIDLRELTEMDTSSIERAIEANTDKVYAKKLEEEKKVLDAQHQKDLSDLKNSLAKEENLAKESYSKQIADLHQQLALAKQSKDAEVSKKEQEVNAKYIQELTSLKEQIKSFDSEKERIKKDADSEKALALANLEKQKDSDYQALQNQQLLDKSNYEGKIKDLENQIKQNDLIHQNELDKKLSEAKETYNASLTEKDNEISNLQRERNLRSVKVQGENLERWCNNEVLSYMQNGLSNCTWEKDNLVVKEEGETKGSKADFLFKVYSSNKHDDPSPLTSVCMDMKSENSDSTYKKKNADYYKQLDLNRTKKKCKYAVLVSELEMEDANDIPIFKVNEYPDMYVVRPNYLMTFLNMIVSLTMRFANLIQEKEDEQEKFKSKQEILDDFEAIKNTYLDKPLESMKKELDNISKSNEAIRTANTKIEQAVANITAHYISQIESKIDSFEIKLNRNIKKIEKIGE